MRRPSREHMSASSPLDWTRRSRVHYIRISGFFVAFAGVLLLTRDTLAWIFCLVAHIAASFCRLVSMYRYMSIIKLNKNLFTVVHARPLIEPDDSRTIEFSHEYTKVCRPCLDYLPRDNSSGLRRVEWTTFRHVSTLTVNSGAPATRDTMTHAIPIGTGSP